MIEVLDADGNPAEGFSGLGAARLMDQDDVAAALLFGPGSNQTRILPLGAGTALSKTIAFRVTMARGAESKLSLRVNVTSNNAHVQL